MPRSGRPLELLVARLEAVASAGEAEVKSPDFIKGTLSGSQREVDVTVRSKVGSASVLVMFECRDRAGTKDVRWIEEIASKRQDVGANVAVAVAARGGFSSGARSMARSLGIELRTVNAITVEDVVGWARLRHLEVLMHRIRGQDLHLQYFADTPPIEGASSADSDGNVRIDLDAPVLTLWDANNQPPPEDPEWVSGKQVHDMAKELMFEQGSALDFSEWRQVSVTMSTQDTPVVAVRTQAGPFPLAGVSATAEVCVEKTQVPVSVHAVTNEEGETTQVLQAVAEYDGQEHTVSFVHTKDGTSVLMDTQDVDSTPDT